MDNNVMPCHLCVIPPNRHRSLSILVNGAAGNFLATAEDLKTKGFKVRRRLCFLFFFSSP